MKPEKPITRKEMYLDVATGGSTELPSPATREEKYLAKIAGESVDVPTPVTRYEMLLAAVAGESYTLTPVTRLEIYLAKAAGQDVEIPQPVTREEMYWFDYCGGTPTPPEREYTGAVPVTFVADGTPLLDYLISGNTAQSGTPTRDNPVMPQGTGERTGNLLNVQPFTIESDSASHNIVLWSGTLPTGTYTISLNQDDNLASALRNTLRLTIGGTTYYESANENYHLQSGQHKMTFTISDSSQNVEIRYWGNTLGNECSYSSIMLNSGSTPLPYEPYGYKIPISSASTTTPVYLGEVESTRLIKKLVLTGDENFTLSYGSFRIIVPDYYRQSGWIPICTHYQGIDSVTGGGDLTNGQVAFLVSASANYYIYICDTNCATAADFKSYLAAQYANGTPVTVWYVLATEETAVVNEPLMKIGDYADTLSMEQAGAQIPTANGSTTLDVETTVKPSEIYIKYKGV